MRRGYREASKETNSLFSIPIFSFCELSNKEEISRDSKQKILLSGGFLLVSFSFLIAQAQAQIVPDATLPVNSIVTPSGNINIIEGGTKAGGNLFHSFQEFSIPTGSEVFFNNALDVQNIFSRITGRSISNIDGLIRANGTANLFLLNPNGIFFGPNARLNIGGSFFASTANSIKFGDGIEFSATNPQSTPLLSINVPIGLQYGKNPGEIRVQGKGQEFGLDGTSKSYDSSLNPLEVLPGKSLTLVGGNVVIDGGILQAPGGRVELGGVLSEGTVELNTDGSLSFPLDVARADISIINFAGINVLAGGGGSITITSRNLDISRDSLLSAGIAEGKGSVDATAGDITLNTTSGMTIASSRIENNVNPDAMGNSGKINITAKSVTFTNGAGLGASTFGQGNAGSVTIVASDSVSFDGERKDGTPSAAFSQVEEKAVGDAGGVSITAKSVTLTNGARLSASTFGKGKAGSVTIVASDSVSFDGEAKDGTPSGAGSTVDEKAVGDAGDVSITAKSLSVTNGAFLNASTRGQGKAGNVKIVASDSVFFDGEGKDGGISAATSQVENAVGDAGGVSITAKSLTLTNGAYLSASTFGKGNAGRVTIVASDKVSFDGEDKDGTPSGALSQVGENAVGDAGGVSITAKSLSVTNGAFLSANTFGKGNAGSVTIVASDSVSFDGESKDGTPSAAASQVDENAVGDAGSVSITAKSVTLTNGAQLNANTFGKGNAGSVTIVASDSVSFDGESKDGTPSAAASQVDENAVGDAGGVSITAKSLSVTNGAFLSANTFGKGNAGSVTIVASDSVSFDGEGKVGFPSGAFSGVAPDAVGDAGGVSITAKSLTLTNGAQITANTFGKGSAGSVTIKASDSVSFDGEDKDGGISGAGSQVAQDAVGDAGGVNITTKSLTLTNGAVLTSSSFGQGAAGSVVVEADSIRLSNSAQISTETIQGKNPTTQEQASISLDTSSLILRRGSRITTNAEGGNIIGGNIKINADVLAGLENSDITANSTNSSGGNITINTQGIFGLQTRTREELQRLLNTDEPNLLDPGNLPTSDITATGANSSLGGTLAINTPEVNPSSGLVDLPTNPVNTAMLVTSNCRRRGEEKSEFIVTGRGGLPPSPNEPIRNEATWIDLREIALSRSNPVHNAPPSYTNEEKAGKNQESFNNTSYIVEAQGWMKNSQGQVVLVAKTATLTPQNSSSTPQYCHEQ